MTGSESDLTVVNDAPILSEAHARAVIEEFLTNELGSCPRLHLFEARHFETLKWGWAFWILPEDRSSYLFSDQVIQWNGTTWEPHRGPTP